MRMAIYAADQKYEGANGRFDVKVDDFEDASDAYDVAFEMSLDRVQDDPEFYDDFLEASNDEGLEKNTDEYYDYMCDWYENQIYWDLWEIKENCPYSNAECEELMKKDLRKFIDKWCII